ncbi:MAG TPA: HD domain-containing phosphohydrolase [Gaiellaceae bacterium]|nr:HD domain-containing phosphohydrolase [Gaiellaceae bacterium]
MRSPHEVLPAFDPAAISLPTASIWPTGRQRILLVDDDPGLRLLLQTTLAADEYAIEEAGSAEEGAELARFWHPALVVLDVKLPGRSGLAFCRELKEGSAFGSPHVVLLTGGETSDDEARAAGADVLLRKPFSPLDLMGAIDSVLQSDVVLPTGAEAGSDQLLAYARDLRESVQTERAQRRLLQQAYRQTISTLTDALEAKSKATGHHGLRVQRYAVELTEAVEPRLLDDPSLEYGFLLHDIGKIGIPEAILEKRGALETEERRMMQQHPLIGTELLAGVPMLEGEGLQVVRSHHERWDGHGYPDGLRGEEIPPVARIFAVADTLDAMTTDRPYRKRCGWEQAVDEILRESGRQFDPNVVRAFATRAQRLRRTQLELAESA